MTPKGRSVAKGARPNPSTPRMPSPPTTTYASSTPKGITSTTQRKRDEREAAAAADVRARMELQLRTKEELVQVPSPTSFPSARPAILPTRPDPEASAV